MSHADADRPADRTPIVVGEVWEKPVTRERAAIVVEQFTVLEGELTIKRDEGDQEFSSGRDVSHRGGRRARLVERGRP